MADAAAPAPAAADAAAPAPEAAADALAPGPALSVGEGGALDGILPCPLCIP